MNRWQTRYDHCKSAAGRRVSSGGCCIRGIINNEEPPVPKPLPKTGKMRCPMCGAEAKVTGKQWECPWCGDCGWIK